MITVLFDLISSSNFPNLIFQDVSVVMPKDLWVESVSVQDGEPNSFTAINFNTIT